MLVLERYCYSPTQGTFARLFLPDAELVTVEQPRPKNLTESSGKQ